MTASSPTTHAAASVRDLTRSLPYTRLFGAAHFGLDDDTSPLRRVRHRERELERR